MSVFNIFKRKIQESLGVVKQTVNEEYEQLYAQIQLLFDYLNQAQQHIHEVGNQMTSLSTSLSQVASDFMTNDPNCPSLNAKSVANHQELLDSTLPDFLQESLNASVTAKLQEIVAHIESFSKRISDRSESRIQYDYLREKVVGLQKKRDKLHQSVKEETSQEKERRERNEHKLEDAKTKFDSLNHALINDFRGLLAICRGEPQKGSGKLNEIYYNFVHCEARFAQILLSNINNILSVVDGPSSYDSGTINSTIASGKQIFYESNLPPSVNQRVNPPVVETKSLTQSDSCPQIGEVQPSNTTTRVIMHSNSQPQQVPYVSQSQQNQQLNCPPPPARQDFLMSSRRIPPPIPTKAPPKLKTSLNYVQTNPSPRHDNSPPSSPRPQLWELLPGQPAKTAENKSIYEEERRMQTRELNKNEMALLASFLNQRKDPKEDDSDDEKGVILSNTSTLPHLLTHSSPNSNPPPFQTPVSNNPDFSKTSISPININDNNNSFMATLPNPASLVDLKSTFISANPLLPMNNLNVDNNASFYNASFAMSSTQQNLMQLQPNVSMEHAAKVIGADYNQIDVFTRTIPEQATQSVNSLSQALSSGSMIRTHTDKCRAFFFWVCSNISYDVDSFFNNIKANDTAQYVLLSRKSLSEGYSNLFRALCDTVGIDCLVIKGHSKGVTFSINHSFEDNSPNHVWNACKIDGEWKLIDTTWGSGYIDKHNRFVRKLNNHYFLTLPEEFIYDHYPIEEKWQLLPHPYQLSQWQHLAHVHSSFFRCNLHLFSHSQDTIHIERNGRKIIILGARFTSSILCMVKDSEGRKVENAVLPQFDKTARNAIYFNILLCVPRPGRYMLNIFAKTANEDGPYASALDYLLIVEEGAGEDACFPKMWGPVNPNLLLISPLTGRLTVGSSVIFKLKSDANDVCVIQNQEWTHLSHFDGVWQGPIIIQPSQQPLQLSAQLNANQNTYSTLFTFHIINRTIESLN